MKKYILIKKFVSVALIMALAGCTNILDEQPRSIYEPGYFKTEKGVMGGLTGLYAGLRQLYGNGYFLNQCITGTDEAIWAASGGGGFKYHDFSGEGNVTPTQNDCGMIWDNAFPNINTASGIIENAEAVGTDEIFFDGDPVNIRDLYNEKSGILDDDEGDVDLTSQAYEIWNQAIKANPELKKKIIKLPDVVYSTKEKHDDGFENNSVITYHRNSHGYEVLSWLNEKGGTISTSQSRILKVAECSLDTPAIDKLENHHDLVKKAVLLAENEAAKSGGQLGSKSSARYRAYGMLTRYYEGVKNTLFEF